MIRKHAVPYPGLKWNGAFGSFRRWRSDSRPNLGPKLQTSLTKPDLDSAPRRSGADAMPLRNEPRPPERLIINGALVKNLDRKSAFLVEGQCKFLRESEIICESEADTPAKTLWVHLQ